jgi:hypothetical protein
MKVRDCLYWNYRRLCQRYILQKYIAGYYAVFNKSSDKEPSGMHDLLTVSHWFMGSVMAVTLGQNFSTLRPTPEGNMPPPPPLDEKGYYVPETLFFVAVLSVLGKPEHLGQTKCIWNNQFSKFPFMRLSNSNSGQA